MARSLMQSITLLVALLVLAGCLPQTPNTPVTSPTPEAQPAETDTTSGRQTETTPNDEPENTAPEPQGESDAIGDALICQGGEAATLVRVVDGDTIVATQGDDSTKEYVRLIGIDTSERGESCFSEATDRLRELLSSPNIRLLKDKSERDHYGRLLRYICSADNVFIEGRLVSEGLAQAYPYKPDTYHADYLDELQQEAAQAQRGCLFEQAMQNSEATDSACCLICRNGKACGNACIPVDVTCRLPVGCACNG